MIGWMIERLFKFSCSECGHKWETKHWHGWYSVNKKLQPVECPHCHRVEPPVQLNGALDDPLLQPKPEPVS